MKWNRIDDMREDTDPVCVDDDVWNSTNAVGNRFFSRVVDFISSIKKLIIFRVVVVLLIISTIFNDEMGWDVDAENFQAETLRQSVKFGHFHK